MARRHTLLAKSRLLEYSEIQASQIPDGTTVYEVSTLPSTVDETKVFIYVTSSQKYYRIKPKEPAQYDSSTADSGIMMGEPAVNMASGYEALFLHRYTSSGSGTQNDGLSVYKPITESVELNSSSMYTPTAQAVSDFVVPKLDSTTYTTSTPTVTLHENTIYRCTNEGVTSMTINISDMVTGPKTRESVVYFHTGNNPSPIAITGGNASTVVFGDTDLMENQDYWVSVKDNTVTITTNLSDVAISGSYTDLTDKPVLNTTSSSALPTNSNETINGTIGLHKISKTGTYDDLIGKPDIPEFLWYGVGRDTESSDTVMKRIGSEELHRTLPIQSKMRRCLLLDNKEVNYYLGKNNSRYKEDGVTAAMLDGTDGQVMVEIPEHYVKYEKYTDSATGHVIEERKISEYPLPGFTRVPKCYYSAFEAAIDRTNNKLSSVINTTAQYRGGNNKAEWDGTYRSLLGMPATSISLTNFRTYAGNRGSGWTCHDQGIYDIVCNLYFIEYANTNVQLSYNSSLDSDGFRQGGLGDGVTTWRSSAWGNHNSYNPVVPCGTTLSLGNNTGTVSHSVIGSDDSTLITFDVPSYRGIENLFGHIWKHTDGILIDIAAEGTSDIYRCYDFTKYSSSVTADYVKVGEAARTNGYTKKVVFPELVATDVGGSSSTYFCDYFYSSIPSSASAVRACVWGGSAYRGALSGLASAYTNSAPSGPSTDLGSRLCCHGDNIGLPPLNGNAGKVLTVNSSETGLEWDSPFSGSYNDLTDTPSIPTLRTINHEQLTDSTLGDINIYDGFYFPNAVSDFDGNWYGAVVIGEQVWLGENLRTTHYADGTAVSGYSDISSPNFTLKQRGLFYLWSAVMNGANSSTSNPSGVQGISPTGWHIPSNTEFEQLNTYLLNNKRFQVGGDNTYIAKSIASTFGWVESDVEYSVGYNQQYNNISGLNIIPTGQSSNGTTNSEFGRVLVLHNTVRTSNQLHPYYAQNNFKTPSLTTNYAVGVWYLPVRCVSNLTPLEFRDWYVNQYGSLQHHLQYDYAQTDSTAPDYIKNAPLVRIYRSLTGTAAVTTSPYYCTRWDVTDSSITEYKDSMVVCVKVPSNGLGNGSYGTALQINSLGYKPIVYNVNSMISTRYAVGSVIWAVYNSTQYGTLYLGNGSQVITGCWQVMDNEDLDCIKYASAIINRNTFAKKKLYINTIDNAFAIADQKYWVIVTTHLKEIDGVTYPYADPNKTVLDDDYWVDSPVVAQASRPGVLFDGSYESNIRVDAGYYMKVHIQFGPFTNNWTPSTTGYIFNGYPYGNYYLSFYDIRTPGQLSKLRIYNKYSSYKGWNLINATPFAGDINSNSYIEKMVNTGLYQCSCMEFIIYSKDSEYTNLCQIDYDLTRGNITHISSVNKFSDQELYKNFTWYKHNDNSENESTVSIEAISGLITSKDIKATNLTASKFVKTDSNKKLVSGDISASDVSDLSTVATSGSYNDLSNKPDLDATLYESLTYSQLVTKIDNSQLIKGRIYRITDFVTTTRSEELGGDNPDINYYDYKSAKHPFDLLVLATSETNIDAKAKAVLHEGDTYFEYCDLDRWQIWYSVENQKCRWGNNDGKGVIYRMIDEWGNDCPYDFKNIMFKRMMTNNELDETNGTLKWVYTFDSGYDADNSVGDCIVYNNRIGNYIFDDDGSPGIYLNDIVFLGFCHNNVFGKDCHSITLHRACNDNKFGDRVSFVVVRNNAHDNIIGNNCEYITINNGSYSNTIKDGCAHIRFGDASNAGGSLCRYNVVGDGNGYINIYNTDNSNDYLQNIYIAPGVNNTSTDLNISTITRGRNYRSTVGRDSNGNIRIYNEDDPALPTVTSEDNGKILMVSDGAWSAQTVPVSDNVLY